ncbi:hypothetical protein PM082_002199 [Marasmius tenuissimus]|nr:hypothetical protein PM082_002199 [Marasmius tenuissimus]
MNHNNGSDYEDLNGPANENPSEQQKMSDKCRYARIGTDTGGISGNWARQIFSEDGRYSQTSTGAVFTGDEGWNVEKKIGRKSVA